MKVEFEKERNSSSDAIGHIDFCFGQGEAVSKRSLLLRFAWRGCLKEEVLRDDSSGGEEWGADSKSYVLENAGCMLAMRQRPKG